MIFEMGSSRMPEAPASLSAGMSRLIWFFATTVSTANPPSPASSLTVGDFSDILFWTGSGTNSAALVLQFPTTVETGTVAPTSIAWEEYDDGTVKIVAERHDQVVALAMRAFREERYAELWEQLVSPGVRARAAAEGGGPEKARERFIEWCAKWRTEVMTLLNRMSFAFSSNQVIFDQLGPGLVRLRLAPQITTDFKYRSIEVYMEQSPNGDRAYLGGIR